MTNKELQKDGYILHHLGNSREQQALSAPPILTDILAQ